VVTNQTYPQHTTGLSLIYQTTWHGWSFDATGYGPAQDNLPLRASDETGLLGGARFATGHSLGAAFATFGLDGLAFEDAQTDRWAQTLGADVEVDLGGQQILSEFAYSQLHGDVSRQLGLYVQDAIPIAANLAGVLRFDYFQPRRGPAAIAGLIGVFWRPYAPLIVKLNYQLANRSSDDVAPGFLASVSLFF
jgi:hypothetical protein